MPGADSALLPNPKRLCAGPPKGVCRCNFLTVGTLPISQAFVVVLLEPQLRPAPSPGSPAANAVDLRRLDTGLAAAAASACGTYFQLLRGSSFSRRIGQPLLTVLEKVIVALSSFHDLLSVA